MNIERLRSAYRKNKSSLSRDELYELIEMIFSIAMKQDETNLLIFNSLSEIQAKRIKELEHVNQRLDIDLTPEQNMIQ